MDLRGGVDGSGGVSGTLEKTADTEFTAAGQKSDDCADQTCGILVRNDHSDQLQGDYSKINRCYVPTPPNNISDTICSDP